MDGRQTEEGGGKILAESNVVRLPRDWLGPRDELIPFGQPADEPAAEASEPIGLPPTADDFWGGEVASAAVPDAAPSRDAVPSGVSRAGARDAIRRRARPISIIGVAVSSIVIAVALIAGATWRSAVRGPLASGASESAPASKPAVSQPAHRQSGRALVAALDLRALSAATLRASQRSAARHARRGNLGLAQRDQSVHASTSTATAQPVHYTSSTPLSESTTSSPPASSAAPPTTTGSSSTNGQTASSGSQPSFGPNGALGPGSSPDG